jgi:hypothetical protein
MEPAKSSSSCSSKDENSSRSQIQPSSAKLISRERKKMYKILFSILVFCYLNNLRVTEVRLDSIKDGIVVSDLGEIRLYNVDYQVVYNINVSYVRTVLGEIEIVYKNYSKFARKTVEKAGPLMTWGTSFLPISKLVLSEFEKYTLEVQQFLGITHSRDRRSLFDLGGRILHGLFVVLDQDEKAELLHKIKEVEDNADLNMEKVVISERKLEEKLINRTSGIINIADNLHKQFGLLTKHEEHDEKNIELIQNELISSSTALSLWIYTSNAREELQKFVRAIMENIYAKLSPELITPRELFTLLVELNKKIEDPWKLPFEASYDSVEQYYNIINVALLMKKDSIKVILSIPLVANEFIFRKYEITKVPVYSPNISSFITHKTHKYVFANIKNNIGFVTNEELKCRRNSNVCKADIAINIAPSQTCEWHLITKQSADKCKKIVKLQKEIFLKRIEDKVVFATRAKLEGVITCRDARGHNVENRIVLENSGILSNMRACDLSTGKFVSSHSTT